MGFMGFLIGLALVLIFPEFAILGIICAILFGAF